MNFTVSHLHWLMKYSYNQNKFLQNHFESNKTSKIPFLTYYLSSKYTILNYYFNLPIKKLWTVNYEYKTNYHRRIGRQIWIRSTGWKYKSFHVNWSLHKSEILTRWKRPLIIVQIEKEAISVSLQCLPTLTDLRVVCSCR